MNPASIAVNGIGHGLFAMALAGFGGDALVLFASPWSQVNAAAAGAFSQTHVLHGGHAIQINRTAHVGPLEQIGVIPDPSGGTTVSDGLSKPGIPADTPEWLRTNLEIMLGRRNNKIEVPALRELVFSGQPTKAECEALYAYTNDVRRALDDLTRRFDS